MPNKALIVFVRNPVLGKVKSRLAATLGDQKALDIYLALLDYTRSLLSHPAWECFVYSDSKWSGGDLWDGFAVHTQSGEDLGQRMQRAFEEQFASGFEKIVLIGSDCAEITRETLQDAFAALDEANYVIGPAKDGGYYLIGMNRMNATLFANILWSSSEVLELTLERLRPERVNLLTALRDVDVEADLLACDWLRKRFVENRS